ncbi:MAG: hypothetical protein ACJASJ_000181 [Candidatus Azotimanducaceae bacterium]|jgi:hypothetical protein|tara:strand:+ start:537 stop:776 length:240 start_codon:yes stop_codon:yes gene_type:complete
MRPCDHHNLQILKPRNSEPDFVWRTKRLNCPQNTAPAAASSLLGEKNGARTGRKLNIAQRDVGAANLTHQADQPGRRAE